MKPKRNQKLRLLWPPKSLRKRGPRESSVARNRWVDLGGTKLWQRPQKKVRLNASEIVPPERKTPPKCRPETLLAQSAPWQYKLRMDYELAMELKDAGFPQSGTGGWTYAPDKLVTRPNDRVYVPTLEELIEACADRLVGLERQDKGWTATGIMVPGDLIRMRRSSP